MIDRYIEYNVKHFESILVIFLEKGNNIIRLKKKGVIPRGELERRWGIWNVGLGGKIWNVLLFEFALKCFFHYKVSVAGLRINIPFFYA